MRIWLPSIIGLLVAACVAREQPVVSSPEQRFEADWSAARNWSEAVAQWQACVQRETAYPHTTAAFGSKHANKPGLHIGEWRGEQDDDWREREVLAVAFRLTLSVTASGDFEALALPESSYAWRVPHGNSFAGEATIIATTDGTLRVTARESRHWSSARVVFRVGGEPTPTRLYQHGSEILVAAWGVALQPVSIELTGPDGKKHWAFLQKSGPE